MGLYSLVCVGPDRNPNCRFSHSQAYIYFLLLSDFQNQINDLTSYIDASNVYGSDESETAELRSFTGGNFILQINNKKEKSKDEKYRKWHDKLQQ